MICLNNEPINVTKFPDGTSQVWHLPNLPKRLRKTARVTWAFNNESEFMHLAQLKHLLDYHYKEVKLDISFLPYGRQDKEVSNEQTFGIRTFANLLNSLDFTEITIFDPHSEVATDLIINSIAVYPTKYVKYLFKTIKIDKICFPDYGAFVKYNPIYDFPFILAVKDRDQATGIIKSLEFTGDVKDKNLLIVDDICDGGGTFIALAQKLLEAGAKEVNLFVSHGLFTKGVKVLRDAGIKRVFTPSGEWF